MIDRGRRSVEERNVDPSQLSTANVEFIHPKLKENMQDDEDPENPFVWLNSYSRVPVSFNEFLKIGLFICSTTYNLYVTSKNKTMTHHLQLKYYASKMRGRLWFVGS